jgi:hypothetical protein
MGSFKPKGGKSIQTYTVFIGDDIVGRLDEDGSTDLERPYKITHVLTHRESPKYPSMFFYINLEAANVGGGRRKTRKSKKTGRKTRKQ